MNHFVINSSSKHFYKKSSHLVRTPITITLQPDEMAFYSVAGQYTSTNWPKGGFLASGSMTSIANAGKSMRSAYHSPSAKQIWRQVTSSHQPENMFYQGAWATSVGTGNERGEAYLQLGGYHFTIPQGLASLKCVGMRLKVIHGGEVCCYQSAQSQNTKNYYGVNYPSSAASAFQGRGWDVPTWEQKVGMFESLNNNPDTMYANAQDTVTLNTGLTIGGNPLGWVRVWTDDCDGTVPHALNPYTQTYTLSQNIINFLNTKQAGWIVTIPYVGGSGDDEGPGFSPNSSMAFYWLCETHWGYTLEVDLA